jgi:hypothetical protein
MIKKHMELDLEYSNSNIHKGFFEKLSEDQLSDSPVEDQPYNLTKDVARKTVGLYLAKKMHDTADYASRLLGTGIVAVTGMNKPVKEIIEGEQALGGLGKMIKQLPSVMNASDPIIHAAPNVPGFMMKGAPIKAFADRFRDNPDYIKAIKNALSQIGIEGHYAEKIMNTGKNFIMTPSNKGSSGTLAHELGHASRTSSLLSAIHYPARALGTMAGAVMAGVGDEDTREWAPIVAGASWLPTLAEEGRASYLGGKGLKKLYEAENVAKDILTRAVRASNIQNLKAFSTYAGGALTAAAAPYVLGKIMGGLDAHTQTTKKSSANELYLRGFKREITKLAFKKLIANSLK